MATKETKSMLSTIVAEQLKAIQDEWLRLQVEEGALDSGLIQRPELQEEVNRFLDAFRRGLEGGRLADVRNSDWEPARQVLEEVSRSRAVQGFTPSQTAMFVFSLKQPLFEALRRACGKDAGRLADEIW